MHGLEKLPERRFNCLGDALLYAKLPVGGWHRERVLASLERR